MTGPMKLIRCYTPPNLIRVGCGPTYGHDLGGATLPNLRGKLLVLQVCFGAVSLKLQAITK
jgi:hypothetical protein